MDYGRWVGLTLKKAKEEAKHQLGVKKMGEARFQMLLDEGAEEIEVRGGVVVARVNELDFLLSAEDDFADEAIEVTGARLPQPEALDVSGYPEDQLPRKGDLYYYPSYQGGVVQGEVLGVYCFAEMLNPDGSFQSCSLTEMSVKKKPLPKRANTTAWSMSNARLRAERDQLLKEIEELKRKKTELS